MELSLLTESADIKNHTLILRIIQALAALSALLSTISWTYRFIDDHSRYADLWFYTLAPATLWGLFIAPLILLRHRKTAVKIIAGVLLVPFSLLWALSVWIGFYGLKIH